MTIEFVDDCDCAHGPHEETGGAVGEAMRKGRLKHDPYRPECPNILSFGVANQTNKYDTLLHFWVLRDSKGGRIGGSADFFESKDEAMRNCIAIFGKEIWAGYHIAATERDHQLLQMIGIEIETRVSG